MRIYDAVIFDFDYTLVDSLDAIAECINYALKEMKIDPVEKEKISKFIGMTLEDTFATLTGKRDKKISDELIALFMERADIVMNDMMKVISGVPEMIEELSSQGVLLGIVSTKLRRRIENYLSEKGLLHYFDIIVGGEDVKKHKPDPEGLEKIIKTMELEKSRVLYVGDSMVDANTSKNCNVDFVAVLSGATERRRFEMFDYDMEIIENIGLLKNIVF